jgi:hypothetical protein
MKGVDPKASHIYDPGIPMALDRRGGMKRRTVGDELGRAGNVGRGMRAKTDVVGVVADQE